MVPDFHTSNHGSVIATVQYQTLGLIQALLSCCVAGCQGIHISVQIKHSQIPPTNYNQLLLHTVHWVCLVGITLTVCCDECLTAASEPGTEGNMGKIPNDITTDSVYIMTSGGKI